MQRFLISIKYTQDIDGVSCFIDGEHDQVREPLHWFAANVFIPNGGSSKQISDAVKILGDQVGKAVAQVNSDEVVKRRTE